MSQTTSLVTHVAEEIREREIGIFKRIEKENMNERVRKTSMNYNQSLDVILSLDEYHMSRRCEEIQCHHFVSLIKRCWS